MKLILDNFILEKYQDNNLEHNEVIEELESDINTKKYLGDLNYSIKRIEQRSMDNRLNSAFIAYYNEYPIGYTSLSYIDKSYQISYGILPKYRKQNIGSLLLEEFSDYLLTNYENIDKLILKIEEDNIGSKQVASLGGYNQENSNTYSRNK